MGRYGLYDGSSLIMNHFDAHTCYYVEEAKVEANTNTDSLTNYFLFPPFCFEVMWFGVAITITFQLQIGIFEERKPQPFFGSFSVFV